MDHLRTILPRVLHRRGLHIQARASQVTHVAERWLKTALPQFATFLQVDRLSHTVLSISCTHGVAAQECLPLLASLRAFIARECGEAAVSEIRMVRSK